MSTQTTQVANYLENLTPAQLVQDEKVVSKFVQLYNAIHGNKLGESIYNKEQFNFMKIINESQELQQCTKMSMYGCFLDVAVNGLSLDNTSRPTCYMLSRNVKSGRKDQNGKDVYEKRASISITGYGELLMRKRAGQINYADNPVVVYEGDLFEAEIDDKGNKIVRYKAIIPRKSNKIIGCFIRIVRNDGSTDYQWMLENDIERLKGYSARSNSKWENGQRVTGNANALYTSNNGQIDPGFLENKMIKHAFDAYPKVRTGDFSILETKEEPTIDYGMASEINEPIQNAQVVNDKDDNSFANPTTQKPTSTITVESDEF